jgi:cation transport protein ChaC
MTPDTRRPTTIPPLRLSRDLVDRLPPRTDERGPVMLEDPPQEFYEDTAAEILARLGPEGVWVFAAGSLIWNPRMEVAERRAAHLTGWRRAFCLTDRRFRGCPTTPGLMMSLDRGGSCSGVVLRMDTGDDAHAALVSLLKKEPPVPPEGVTADTDAGPVPAILFAADPAFPLYRPEPEIDELADILASAVGHVGTMAEYLLNTVTELERHGVHDLHLWRLQEMVAERLEGLPEPVAATTGPGPAGQAGDRSISPKRVDPV